MIRVGVGFDAHRFDDARPLVLGGITIPDSPGLGGHSDADVVCHAVADALLGAAALGDLGDHFPATPEWENASGLDILRRAEGLVDEEGYRLVNVDVTVITQRPRLDLHRDGMRKAIADALSLDPGAVSVKATTTDEMGSIGRTEGIAAHAVALIESR